MKQFTTEQLRNELANRGFHNYKDEQLKNELAKRGYQTANLLHIDDVLQNYNDEQLRNELANRGFQTATLWHIDDVLQNYDCCDEDALYVIRVALNNDFVRECIFEIIDEVCSQEGIKQLNK